MGIHKDTMSDDDYAIDAAGDSGAAATYPMEAGQIRKGGYIVVKDRPCKVVDVSASKTGKHGHAKCHFVTIDIFTGKKLEELCPATTTPWFHSSSATTTRSVTAIPTYLETPSPSWTWRLSSHSMVTTCLPTLPSALKSRLISMTARTFSSPSLRLWARLRSTRHAPASSKQFKRPVHRRVISNS